MFERIAETWGISSCQVIFALSLLFGISGCQTTSEERIRFEGDSLMFEGRFFEHRIGLRNSEAANDNEGAVVVVIEGDGRPWAAPGRLSLDPTSPDPLLLHWFDQWPGRAIYVGRPCYFGAKEVSPPEPSVEIKTGFRLTGCDPYWFTLGRYSDPVVQSMVEAIQAGLKTDRPLILIGHSGGGTLAMLLAGRMSQVRGVITLAGNLQVTRWQESHSYTPLYGSLDPASEPVLPAKILQLHLAASRDNVISPDWIEHEAARQHADFLLWEGDHNDTWKQKWPEINALVQDMIERLKSG
ncbi:hypothetical protein BTA51_08935 [Hahella sp. CCB-MM4]|uniref:alpha/beta fold hydrolase n=1 Tax=Hahella sp. (strain CCB-MM4) TaxID=1926491 RepID=UPI000B9C1B73|nr:alpha/beta fold hydrolase [Hahella sp. CCB-MM4]OZG73899.1 hypothetical protein BTA51_08935 [Hahella sp. CCB-MM4]